MKCQYCNKTCCRYDDLHYHCLHCNTSFHLDYIDGPVIRINMFAFIKGKRWVLQILPKVQSARIIYAQPNRKESMVTHLSGIPNWTPKNLKEKLKTFLVFT